MKKTMQKLLLALVMGCCALLSHAQQRTVTGTVTDETGKPIAGATITVKGTLSATASDDAGSYSIEVANNAATLVASSLGFTNKEATVGNNNVVNFILTAGIKSEEEVVVTALGIKREARSLGYSAQKVTTTDIMKAAPPDLASGLMGKAAGLNISQSNGVQGNSARIVIRGNNSLTGNNQPLIVVDGVQVQNTPIGGQLSSFNDKPTDLVNTKDWGSFLNSLNSEDIQDISVLKGATAAALYGARGANGVILVTTKKGSNRKGLGIDYNFSQLYTDPYRYQDVQNEYGYGGANSMWSANIQFPKTSSGELRYPGYYPWDGTPTAKEFAASGAIPGGYNTWDIFSWWGPASSWGHKLDGTEIIWWDGTKRKWDPQPDNRSAFYRWGLTSTHNLAINKSGDFGSVRFSYTRLDNTSIYKNSGFNQNNFNLGSNLNISKKLKAEITASYNNYYRLNAPDIGADFGWSTFSVYAMPRDYKPIEFDLYKQPDGSKTNFSSLSPFGMYPYNNNYNQHLFWHLMEQNQRLNRNQLLGAVKLSADLTDWWNLSGRASVNNAVANIESKYSPVDAAGVQGQYGIASTKSQDLNLEWFSTFHKDELFTSKLNGSLLIGGGALKSRYYDNAAWNSGENGATFGKSSTYPWAVPNKYYLANTTNAAGIAAPIENWSNYNINSLYGLLNLSYDNYLFLEVTGRNDWNSTLPTQYASYFFPSANLSFVFSDAINGIKNSGILSYGKLKLSAAQSANGGKPYITNYVYNSTVISNYLNGDAPNSFGGVPVRRYPIDLPPQGNILGAQRTTSYEIGAELGFLKNRLNLDLTFYNSRSTNQILSGNLATSSGAQSVWFNTGELANKGFEFIVRATPVKQENFNWDITVNGAHNQNKVVTLSDGIDRLPLQDLWGLNGVQMYVKAGDNYGTIYGYDYTYKDGQKVVKQVFDQNDKTKVVGTQYVTTDDPVAIGNATPKLTGGIANSFRYKNFSLYFLTDFKIGGQVYAADYSAAMSAGLSPETLKERSGGGLPYTFPDGSTANVGVILDGVLENGSKNTEVVHYLYKYAGQYAAWSGIRMPRSNAIFENSWGKLRELTLSYSVPSNALQGIKFIQGLDVSLIGRNLFYLFTTLPDRINPEAISGIGNAQGVIWSEMPATRDFGFSVKVKF